IPLLSEQNAAFTELKPEPAADQDDRGRPGLAGHPVRPLIAARVNPPLNLDFLAVPDVVVRHEVPEQPAPVAWRIPRRRAGVDRGSHKGTLNRRSAGLAERTRVEGRTLPRKNGVGR